MPATTAMKPDTRNLVEDHVPMARQIAARLKRRYMWVNRDDLYSYALLGLTLTARLYDPERGVPFPQFAARKALFMAVDEMRKDGIVRRSNVKKLPHHISLNEPVTDDGNTELDLADYRIDQQLEQMEAKDLCRALLKRLRSNDRRLMMMYYGDHMTFREIAEVMDISESSVCLRHKALLDKLKKMARTRHIGG
ncbi:MAG: sigma-70 family RNA polymerase sigma factor [Phycisphaerae bacterium]